jgi:carbon-monoxide dehydrogenase small subunit
MAGGKSRPESKKRITITVNGKNIDTEIDVRMTLAEFLREELDLTGTKVGCNMGECGSCTVILDGKPVYSCTTLAVEALGKEVHTVEGLSKEGKLHPLQASFIKHDGLQCGYCTPGMIMSTKALLDSNPHPTEYDVRRSIDGNLCRCGSYLNIIKATINASEKIPR